MEDNYIEKKKQEVIELLKSDTFKDSKISYILFKPNSKDIIMLASRNDDISLELFLRKNGKNDFECKLLSNQDFSAYENIFRHLDNGYEIIDMKMSIHYINWKEIAKKYTDEYYFKGVHKYLQYCKENEITKDILEKKFNEELDDIMTYSWNQKKMFIIGEEKVEMSRYVFEKRLSRFYWAFVLGQELPNTILSKYDKQPYHTTYDFYYHLANEFIDDTEITSEEFDRIDILKKWIKESEKYIVKTYEQVINQNNKEDMER